MACTSRAAVQAVVDWLRERALEERQRRFKSAASALDHSADKLEEMIK